MKKENEITTAANTRTLNAVEKEKLYAAAGAVDPEQNYSELNDTNPKDWSSNKQQATKKKNKLKKDAAQTKSSPPGK